MKYSLVQFQDKGKLKCLVLTKDIKGFEPMSHEDIPNHEYLVKWQSSFHGGGDDDDDEHHDGCYPAKVLLVGATPEEVRLKAKELKIRLPLNFPPLENEEKSKQVPMKEPLRKTRRTSEMETHQLQAKKKRMDDTLKCLTKNNEEAANSSNMKAPRSKQEPQRKTRRTSEMETHQSKTKKRMDVEVSSKSSDGSESGNHDCDDDNDEDDATVLLAELKREHNHCVIKIEELEARNTKLSSDINLLQKELTWKRSLMTSMKSEVDDLKALNFDLQRQLRKRKCSDAKEKSLNASSSDAKEKSLNASSSDAKEKSLNASSSDAKEKSLNASSPDVPERDRALSETKSFSPEDFETQNSQRKSFKTSPVFEEKAEFSKEVKSVKKSPRRDKAAVVLNEEESVKRCLFTNDADSQSCDEEDAKESVKIKGESLSEIAMRVCKDLKGEQLLPGNADEVHVGLGLKINRRTWEKSLRTRKDDSKFYKDCAGVIWGRDDLKQRTGQRASAGKKPCTPKKVMLLNAMLKGKMMARGEGEQQQTFIVSNFAPKWLTDKCYDSGRPPKPSKKS